MAAIWTAKPSLTDAQVKARFGSGARLVRMGDGRWTIAGAETDAQRDADARRNALAGATPAVAPGTAAAPTNVGLAAAPAATPALPPPDPVSFGQQSNITNLTAQRAGLSGIYNPQRQALYAEGARGLTDQGYYDLATPMAVSTDPVTGAVSYTVAGRGEGRVYRENRGNINASNNSRGMLNSSATRTQQRQSATALENARQAALRSLASNQDAITRQQTADFTGLSGEIGNAQGNYADWRASQSVPLPAPVSETVVPAPPKPPTAGSTLPRIITNPGARSIPALRRMGYRQSGTRWIRS